jgi:hypothetical protein
LDLNVLLSFGGPPFWWSPSGVEFLFYFTAGAKGHRQEGPQYCTWYRGPPDALDILRSVPGMRWCVRNGVI